MIKQLPNKWKYGRVFNVNVKSSSSSFNLVQYYTMGLAILDDCEVFYNQLFSVFKVLKKYFKKRALIKFNVSLQIPFTKKSVSARMGKGKGQRKGFKAVLKKGTIIFELGNITYIEGINVLLQCSKRLPVKTRICFFKL